VPAPRYSWRAYSSLLPYRSNGRIVLPGALSARPAAAYGQDEMTGALHAAQHGELRFALAVGPALLRFAAVGELRAQHHLSQSAVQALRFNPFHTAESIIPAAGPLNGMRRAAYAASQRVRPDASQ
jgi:type II secretory pathway component PulK